MVTKIMSNPLHENSVSLPLANVNPSIDLAAVKLKTMYLNIIFSTNI